MMIGEAPAKEDFESNRFRMLDDHDDSEEDVFVCVVENTKTRSSAMRFHVAKVQRPLESAAKIVKAVTRIRMGPEEADDCIENDHTGEQMQTRV